MSYGIFAEQTVTEMEKELMRKLLPWIQERIDIAYQKKDRRKIDKLKDEIKQLQKDKDHYMNQYWKYKKWYERLVKATEPSKLMKIANKLKEALF